jgi:D-amino-acid oxidase
VIVHRSSVTHIADAAQLHHSGHPADLIVNCTGLLASRLGGVQDSTVVPVRGQTILVSSPPGQPGIMVGVSGTDDAREELAYVMGRAAGMWSSFLITN